MKRDMNLIRQILLWADEQQNGMFGGNPSINGYTEEQIGYHVYLMGQAGLVRCADCTSIGMPSPYAMIIELTWSGHDFVDAIKDDSLWKKATTTVIKDGASFSFELVKEWMLFQAKQTLGLP